MVQRISDNICVDIILVVSLICHTCTKWGRSDEAAWNPMLFSLWNYYCIIYQTTIEPRAIDEFISMKYNFKKYCKYIIMIKFIKFVIFKGEFLFISLLMRKMKLTNYTKKHSWRLFCNDNHYPEAWYLL